MAHFSLTQRKGCTEILQSLSYSDLFSLKDTVANKLTTVFTKEEAISAILNCSQSAEELLKRRKVLREAILKYLIRHDVVISASSEKQQLIDKALFYWIQQECKRNEPTNQTKYQLLGQVRKHELEQKEKQEIDEAKVRAIAQEVKEVRRELEQTRQAEEQLRRQVEEQTRKRAEEQTRRRVEEQTRRQVEEQTRRQVEEQTRRQVEEQTRRQVEEQTRRQVEEQARRQMEEQKSREVEEQMKRRVQEQMRKQVQDEAMEVNIHVNIRQYQISPQTASGGVTDCQTIGKEFCQWFFQLLNSQNPSFGQLPEEWGPQHFWEDAVLHFVHCVHEEQTEHHQSAAMVSLRLLSLVTDEQLLFNPNISENGMRCETSPHGLAAVAVAGTIHKSSQCLGIFEQLFGLIRTPVSGNNWKIKYVKLQVKALSDQQEVIQPNLSLQLPALQAHLNELSAFLK
ncbi:uncharacterized protein C3orf38 homolog [Heptranchias perlo]|uniref:uncharacterized protein C3orf38 homolog n=1 Tax=Heptranchias perlo TaxID=212740 RepID=UPI003559E33F